MAKGSQLMRPESWMAVQLEQISKVYLKPGLHKYRAFDVFGAVGAVQDLGLTGALPQAQEGLVVHECGHSIGNSGGTWWMIPEFENHETCESQFKAYQNLIEGHEDPRMRFVLSENDWPAQQLRSSFTKVKNPSKIRTMSHLNVGSTSYRLQKAELVTITETADGTFRFEVSGFSPTFVGEGDSSKAARRQFYNKVHSRFQLLSKLRPFQMDGPGLAEWAVLERQIDVEHYWSQTPVRVIETGFVKKIDRSGNREFAWSDGQRCERLPLEKLQPEFVALPVGQWFECLAVREPGTYELREITFIQAITRTPTMTEQELSDWMKGLPDVSLPRAETSLESL